MPHSPTSTDRLYVSFWDMSLDNLPEGTFMRRRIIVEEAKQRIGRAKEDKRLLCLSAHDLAAPYKEKERDNHDALCRVLDERFDIGLSLEDFFSGFEHEGDTHYSVNPLNCVQIDSHHRLMVVTCAYVPRDRHDEAWPGFKIDPSTVEFHLIEAA